MKAKQVVAEFMTAAMTMGMLAGCGSNNTTGTANAGSNSAESESDAGESTDAAGTESAGSTDTSALAGTQITMLNSKGEIQTALEDVYKRQEFAESKNASGGGDNSGFNPSDRPSPSSAAAVSYTHLMVSGSLIP